MATQRAARIASAAVILSLAAAWPVRSQSLADVAKKEEERRKAAGTEPAKVYTNKDLSHKNEPPPPEAGAKPADASKDAAKDKDAKDGKDAKDAKDKDGKDAAKDKDDKAPVKDRAYWLGRMKAAQEKLLRDSNYLDAMQTRINALNTDFVNRDDPIQKGAVERDRQKAIAEQNKLKADVAADKKAIADLEEEARRAGIPPGWLR